MLEQLDYKLHVKFVQQQKSKRPPLFVYLIILGFAVLLSVLSVLRFQKNAAMKQWPVVSAHIEKCEITSRTVREKRTGESSSTTKTVYRCTPEYFYEYEGHQYKGRSVSLEDQEGSLGKAEDILEAYPQGATMPVHVNPAEATEAYLDISLGFSSYGMVGFAALLIVLFFFMVYQGFVKRD